MKKSKKKTATNVVVVSVHLKGFSTRLKTSFAHVIASLIPTALKPLIMESFWFLRWLCVSTIHRAWRSFKSPNLRDILTSLGATLFDNCLLTVSAHHALNLFEINFFTDWLMLISKGSNLFVRLCGTIINLQLFFAHNRFISSFSWPLKVSIVIKERWYSGQPSSFFLADKYGKIISLSRSSHFLN